MQATIIYSTARPTPRLDWIIDGLARQAMPGDEIELIVVDALGRPATAIGYRRIAPIVRLVETLPKPCAWQGAQRITSRDWWAVSSARNTGAILASTPYLIFVDDRCRLGPRWMAAARLASQEHESVVSGSYQKHEDGKVTIDHRCLTRPSGLTDCGGSWLFGCVIAMPLAWFLEVGGFEEGCDGLSMEDSILGLMLANRGRRIDFRPELLVLQERSVGTGHGCVRTDKGISPNDKSHAAIARFGARTHTEYTPDLVKLRARIAAGGRFPDVDRQIEHRDWYDGQLLQDMVPPP